MLNQSLPIPHTEDLQHLFSQFLEHHYKPLEVLSAKVGGALESFDFSNVPLEIAGYGQACHQLIQELNQYFRLHRLVLVPYINDLVEKEDNGHDCRNCSNGCAVKHASQVLNIRDAHDRLEKALAAEAAASVTLNNAGVLSDPFLLLHQDIKTMVTETSEMIFLEKSVLIPMVLDLQRKIGVHA